MRPAGFRREGIGSRFPLPLGPLLGRPRGEFRWPGETWLAFETGRAAIGWLLDALGLGAGDRALLPAYICDAAVAPFNLRGVGVDFYRVRPDLVPDGADAAARLTPATRLLMVVHYFGFPAERGVLGTLPVAPHLIRLEDWVQSALSEGALESDGFGEYRVLAFHKILPLPDSGLLIRRAGVPAPPHTPPLRAPRPGFFGRRLVAKALKSVAVALSGGAPRPLYRPLFDAAERAAGGGVPARMSSLSRRMLERTAVSHVVARRRDNFRWLADALARGSGVSLLRKDLPDGVCPLGLPLRVANRDRVLHHLIANRVYAPVHWRLPEAVDPAAFPEAAKLAAEEITLPVDQRYGRDEMAYVARTLAEGVRRGEEGGKG